MEYSYIEEMLAKATEWLNTVVKLGGPLGEDVYMKMMHEECVKFMSEEWCLSDHVPGIEEWVRTDTWLKGKSGTDQFTNITIGIKTVKTRRMKGVDAKVYTEQDICLELIT